MEGKIFAAIPKVMHAIGSIGKDRKNAVQGYSFRGIDDLYNAASEALIAHEVFTVPVVLDMKREERQTKSGGGLIYTILTIKYTFYASDGSHFEAVTIGEAMDSGDKSCNKAMSAAQKYAFLQVFAIPTEEPKDTENETHEIKKKEAVKAVTGGSLTGKPPASEVKEEQKAHASESAPAGDMVILYIEDIEKKTGVNAKTKKPWTSWTLKVGDSKWGTFSGSVAALAEEARAVGRPVEVTYITKEFAPGKHSNEIVTLKMMDDSQEMKGQSDLIPF